MNANMTEAALAKLAQIEVGTAAKLYAGEAGLILAEVKRLKEALASAQDVLDAAKCINPTGNDGGQGWEQFADALKAHDAKFPY